MTKPMIYWLSRHYFKFKLFLAFIINLICRRLTSKLCKSNDVPTKYGKEDFVFNCSETKLLEIKANISELEYVITALRNDMARYKASDSAEFNMVMAAEEMFSNIALYAYEPENKGKVAIYTSFDKNVYYITFIDRGKKYNPLQRQAPDISIDLKYRKVGGLGTFLAKKYADTISYSYQNGQNILKMGIIIKK